jgi:hypothetical protein
MSLTSRWPRDKGSRPRSLYCLGVFLREDDMSPFPGVYILENIGNIGNIGKISADVIWGKKYEKAKRKKGKI